MAFHASASSNVGAGGGAGLPGADLCGGGVGALPLVVPLTLSILLAVFGMVNKPGLAFFAGVAGELLGGS